jgi:hypothetical protein
VSRVAEQADVSVPTARKAVAEVMGRKPKKESVTKSTPKPKPKKLDPHSREGQRAFMEAVELAGKSRGGHTFVFNVPFLFKGLGPKSPLLARALAEGILTKWDSLTDFVAEAETELNEEAESRESTMRALTGQPVVFERDVTVARIEKELRGLHGSLLSQKGLRYLDRISEHVARLYDELEPKKGRTK